MDNNSGKRIKVALRVLAARCRIGDPVTLDEIQAVKVWAGDDSLADTDAAIAVINCEVSRRATTTTANDSQSG